MIEHFLAMPKVSQHNDFSLKLSQIKMYEEICSQQLKEAGLRSVCIAWDSNT